MMVSSIGFSETRELAVSPPVLSAGAEDCAVLDCVDDAAAEEDAGAVSPPQPARLAEANITVDNTAAIVFKFFLFIVTSFLSISSPNHYAELIFTLTFYRTDHDTLGEIFLQERIYQQNRYNRNNDNCVSVIDYGYVCQTCYISGL